MSVDPREEHNLATDQPDRVARMRATLDRWWNPADDGAIVRWRAILC